MKKERTDDQKNWRKYKEALIALLQVGDQLPVDYIDSWEKVTIININNDSIVVRHSYILKDIIISKCDISYTKQCLYLISWLL